MLLLRYVPSRPLIIDVSEKKGDRREKNLGHKIGMRAFDLMHDGGCPSTRDHKLPSKMIIYSMLTP